MLYEEYLDLTIYGMLERMENRFQEKLLFCYKEDGIIKEISYRQFFSGVKKIAGYFRETVSQGSLIVIDSRNTYEQIAAMFAAASAGVIPVLVNFNLPDDEIESIIERVSPAMIVYDREDEELLAKYLSLGTIPCLCCTENPFGSSVREILDSDRPLYQNDGAIKPEDPAMILMTSGSTSRSKLVVLPHHAFLPHSEVWTEKSIFVLPMCHIAGLNILINDMARGIPICLSSLKNGLRDIEWFRPKDIFAVPAFVSQMVKKSQAGRMDLSCFKNISSGGAPQNMDTVAYLNSLGIFTMSLYGATETAGIVDYSTPETYRYGSVGKPGPWNDIRISEAGEILVKGKNVMIEYLGDPEATEGVLVDGWYHTGDLGYIDDDGYLFITGRIKNIIILSNGENVSPEALESKLSHCEDVEEVVVSGHRDTITAHIWCGDDAGEEKMDRVRSFVARYNRTVPTYYRIRKIEFRERPFEKTASGKIKR